MSVQAPGPYELTPVFVDEDVSCLVTMAGSGSIAAYSFRFRVWKEADGTSVINSTGAPEITITDAALRKVTWLVAGLTLAEGVYRWSLRRTDAGSRTLVAWGSFMVRGDTDEPFRD